MAATADFIAGVPDRVGGNFTSGQIDALYDDAVAALASFGIDNTNPNYAYGLILYGCHLVELRKGKKTSVSTPDISVSYQHSPQSNKFFMTSYLQNFLDIFEKNTEAFFST